MKKFLKVFFISLASFLVLAIAAISVVLWFVFTPEKLTPIVRNQTARFLTCQTEIGEVELTFFSTFPQFGIRINQLTIINPMPGAQSDTLLSVDKFIGALDIKALWYFEELKLSGISLYNGTINVYADAEGNTNYNILATESDAETDSVSEFPFGLIDLGNINLQNINLSYIDLSMNLDATVSNLFAKISGTINPDSIIGQIDISQSDIAFEYTVEENQHNSDAEANPTSTAASPSNTHNPNIMSGVITNLSANLTAAIYNDSIISHLLINHSNVSFTNKDENYLSNAAVQLNLPIEIKIAQQHIRLKNATATVNNQTLLVNGTVENDTINKTIIADINYDLKSWPIKEMMALIPPSYHNHLDSIDADGILTSNGKITGAYGETSMPLMDIHFLIENGKLKYKDFPLPLDGINGDLNIYTDLKNNQISYIKINRLKVNTPKSTVSTSGTVNNLFSDIYINLASDAAVVLEEFNTVITESMSIKMKGDVQGRVKSAFSLSQVQKMELEKMRLSGNLSMTNLDVIYDSLWVKTDQSKLEFSLPNHNATSNNTKFAFAKIISGNLETGKQDSYQAILKNADISIETSDARDTTRIPDLICIFTLDRLEASMDTLSLAIQKPVGRVWLAPGNGMDQPRIEFNYKSNELEAAMGQLVIDVEKLNLETTIVNDKAQSDIFLQWLVKGFINMDQGSITSSNLKYPVSIPSIKMNFEPEVFDIEESRMVISNSDFELSGKLQNILSYFRGDSLLRGNFRFVSNLTDVHELMNLTNGLGNNPETKEQTSDKGPYMVPKGVDILLTTNIKHATYLESTATDITGDVTVKDGILVLDELNFTSPAAKAQLTAIYRTPRKNHIYMGLDYHLLDVEIAELLEMIPEIDTLMPMLRSFGGRGEFHMAIETYLDSTYSLKKSTLRGAASISGKDMVLMDGETYSMIARKLRFKKRTQNRVRSLNAEFTVFRDEIDVYPLLLEMDKYSAVVGGRHNTDLSFDYIVSVVESPFPFRLGLNIIGNMDNYRIRLGRPRYAKNYQPVVRGVVAKEQLELRKMIRESITPKARE
jgi:hypothetical protein